MPVFYRKQLFFLRTPIGRFRIANRAFIKSWPLLRRVAKIYRTVAVRKPRFVAVVGSQGKTTTSRAVAAALGLPDYPSREYNEFSYVALAMFKVHPRHDYAVIEVGIGRQGQMRTYAETIRPDITVVTSISSEHNRSFKDFNSTRAEKVEMIRALPPSGLAVLNGDDPNVLWMKGQTRARTITYGFSDTNDVRAIDAALDWPEGMRFKLQANGVMRDVRTRLIGRTFIYPILAAVAVGLAVGRSLEAILAALEHLPPTPGRLEPVRLDSGAILLRDEFKSSLETIDVALDVLAEIPARRKIVVLGDISEPPGSLRPIYRRLGGRIAAMAAQAIFYGTSCQVYAAGAAREGMPREAMTKAGRSLEKALAAMPTDLGEGDVILVKGRTDQRLGRISLALMGRQIRCDLPSCFAFNTIRCDRCKMLERGWRGIKIEV